MTSLVTEFAAIGSLDGVLAQLEERDERAMTDVLLEAAMHMLERIPRRFSSSSTRLSTATLLSAIFSPSSSRVDAKRTTVKLTDYALSATGTSMHKATYSGGEGLPFR